MVEWCCWLCRSVCGSLAADTFLSPDIFLRGRGQYKKFSPPAPAAKCSSAEHEEEECAALTDMGDEENVESSVVEQPRCPPSKKKLPNKRREAGTNCYKTPAAKMEKNVNEIEDEESDEEDGSDHSVIDVVTTTRKRTAGRQRKFISS